MTYDFTHVGWLCEVVKCVLLIVTEQEEMNRDVV